MSRSKGGLEPLFQDEVLVINMKMELCWLMVILRMWIYLQQEVLSDRQCLNEKSDFPVSTNSLSLLISIICIGLRIFYNCRSSENGSGCLKICAPLLAPPLHFLLHNYKGLRYRHLGLVLAHGWAPLLGVGYFQPIIGKICGQHRSRGKGKVQQNRTMQEATKTNELYWQ